MSYKFPRRQVPCVPKAQVFNSPDSNEFRDANMQQFPPGNRTKAAAFYLDGMLPVPRQARETLV
jgi:hypothetical protein